MRVTILHGLVLLLLSQGSWAVGFSEGWQAAKLRDPAFQGALADAKAGALNKDIARAGLLPQIGLSTSRFKVNGRNAVGNATQQLDYFSDTKSLQLRQPLLNAQKVIEYQQGVLRSNISQSVLRSKELDLAVRYSNAYFNVLFAKKTIELYEAKKKTTEERMSQAQHLFESGEGVVTDVDDAQTRLDLINAAVVEAEQNLFNAQSALKEIMGESPATVSGLKDKFAPYALAMPSREDWINYGLESSAEIIMRKQALQLADKEVKRNYAQHLPTLDLVATHSRDNSASVSTLNQNVRTNQVGIQFNLPIFSGGGLRAQTEQAVAGKERAAADLEMATVEISNEIEKQFYASISGANKIVALEKALVSAERAVKSNTMGFKAGVRTNLDVLNAQEQIFQIRKDLIESKLGYITSLVKLYATAGILTDEHLKRMDAFFDKAVVLPKKSLH